MNDTANIINITNHRYYPTILTNDTNQLYYMEPSPIQHHVPRDSIIRSLLTLTLIISIPWAGDVH